MFRKIFFIFLSVFQMQILVKGIILLSISFIFLFLVIIKKPFIMEKLNYLEYKSSFAALITLFIGNLYICDIPDMAKGICFILIIVVNTYFFCGFLFDVLYLLLTIHFDKIYKMSPKIAKALTSFFVNFDEFDITRLNLQVLGNFFKNKQESISTSTTAKQNFPRYSFFPKTKVDEKNHQNAKNITSKKIIID